MQVFGSSVPRHSRLAREGGFTVLAGLNFAIIGAAAVLLVLYVLRRRTRDLHHGAENSAPRSRRYWSFLGQPTRYCQMLCMTRDQAASFLTPSTKGTPSMTSAIN